MSNDLKTTIPTSDITPINSELAGYVASLTSAKDIQANAIARQNDVKNILYDETDRLKAKKAEIDTAIKAQSRIIFFNDNSRKRYAAYLKIIIAIVIVLVILFMLKLIYDNFSVFIPLFIIQLLFVFTICGGSIYIWIVFASISRHSRYNYDEINLDPPNTAGMDLSGNSNISSTLPPFRLTGSFCVDNDCCDNGTVWNDATGKCTIPTSIMQGFTTLSAMPAYASEYSEYAPYK